MQFFLFISFFCFNIIKRGDSSRSPPVSQPLEVEPELEYVVVELALEPSLVAQLPLAADYLEGDVLVRRARADAENLREGENANYK